MAKINTGRPEAAAFNGRECEFVHDVTPLDGAAFDKNIDQTIVRIDGQEYYFFANEVELTEPEKKRSQKHADETKATLGDAEQASKDNTAAKAKMHSGTKRGGSAASLKPDETKVDDSKVDPMKPSGSPIGSGSAPAQNIGSGTAPPKTPAFVPPPAQG